MQRMTVIQITTPEKNRLQRTIQARSEDGAQSMAAVSRIVRSRGIHEETSTGITYNIGTAMPMGSHRSIARIPPIRAVVIPEVPKLNCPAFMELAPLFAFLYYSPHLLIGQGLCLFPSCGIHPHDAPWLSTPEKI